MDTQRQVARINRILRTKGWTTRVRPSRIVEGFCVVDLSNKRTINPEIDLEYFERALLASQ